MNTSLIRRAFPLLVLTLGLAGASQASQIAQVTFDGPTTGVNDGAFYVAPYQVTIDVAGSDPVTQLVTCYDIFDEVSNNDSWTTSLQSLDEVSATGYFSADPTAKADYQTVAWLSSQTYSNSDQQIALQHAIWSIFGGASTPANQNTAQNDYMAAYLSAADAAALGGYANFDFNDFVFIESENGVAGQGVKQAFVFETTPGPNSIPTTTPEPGTWAMIAGGLALVVVSRRRFSRN